jgi:hypothetical protein
MDPAEHKIVQYLLDELDPDERASLDERICRDPSFFEVVCAIEDDLIMAYLRGELEASKRAQFEALYLADPSTSARVASARELKGSLREIALEQDERRLNLRKVPVGLRWGLALAAGLLVLAIFLWPSWRGGPSLQTHPSEVTEGSLPTGESVLYVLEPGLLRSGSGNHINVPATAHVAQFDLNASNSLPGNEFDAILGTPEKPGIWKGTVLRKDHRLSVSVPATVLTTGDYTLSISAASNFHDAPVLATYYFRVVKSRLPPGQL